MRQIDDGFILAAGYGKRMQPYTIQKPKPMLQISGTPIIGHSIQKLLDSGIKNISVNTHYKGEILHQYLTQLDHPNINISHEDELLDTGGGIKNALSHFDGRDFFVLSGDSFWEDTAETPCLKFMQDNWNPVQMDILMLLQDVQSMTITTPAGDYDLDEQGRAIRALDKTGRYMFTSIRINKSQIFDETPDGPFSYLDLMDKAQEQGRLYGIVNPGAWHHISTPQDLDNINAHLQNADPQEKAV